MDRRHISALDVIGPSDELQSVHTCCSTTACGDDSLCISGARVIHYYLCVATAGMNSEEPTDEEENDRLIHQAAGNEVSLANEAGWINNHATGNEEVSLATEPGVATVANNDVEKQEQEIAAIKSIVVHAENVDIAVAFYELTELYQKKYHNKKAVAKCRKVVSAILNLPFPITIEIAISLGRQGDPNKVADIGAQSADKMLEFLQTGNIEMLRAGKIEMLQRKRRQLAKKLDRLINIRNEVALAAGVATVANNVEWKITVGKSENGDMAAAFHELAALYHSEGSYSHTALKYRKVTKAILRLSFEITIENAKSLGKPGNRNKVADIIGAQSADKMLEFLQTGTMEMLEQQKRRQAQSEERNLPVNSKWQWVRGARAY